MSENAIQSIIEQLADGQDLAYDDAVRAFQIIMNGGATPAQMGAFLMGLCLKGETVEEITAGATAMRVKATKPFDAPEGAMDVCGTGGDNKGSLNISTAVAFVLAACGVPVIKHGNRSVSSKSGSSDVLTELGITIDAPAEVMQRALAENNICFLMAPLYHKAVRHVAPVRQELGIRTIFNILGPLANPAAPSRQLVGVYDRALVEPIAEVLNRLGLEAAWVVHGAGGLDELSLAGKSHVAELKDGEVTCFTVSPADARLEESSLQELVGGNAKHNAQELRKVLMGEKNAYRDAVIFNTAAALIVAGKAEDLAEGAALAAHAIDEGKAYSTLNHFATATLGSHV